MKLLNIKNCELLLLSFMNLLYYIILCFLTSKTIILIFNDRDTQKT